MKVENKGNIGNPNHKPAGSPDGGQFTSSNEISNETSNLKSDLLSFIKAKKEKVDFELHGYISHNAPVNAFDLQKSFESGTNDGRGTVNNFYKTTGTKIRKCEKNEIAHYSPSWKCVYFCNTDLSNKGKQGGNYEPGEVFYHETFHGIDDRYGNLSSSYKLSNGKTLKEIMHDEIADKKYSWNMDLYHRVDKEYKEARKMEVDKMFGEGAYEKYSSQEKYFRNKLLALNSDMSMKGKYLHGSEYYEAYDKYVEEFKAVKKEWKAVSDAHLPAIQKATHKFSCLSDFCSFIYRTGAGNQSICGGHPKKYWSQDGGNKAVKEMWAELGSMWARGKTEDLNRMREYFPETVKGFEELVSKLDEIRKEKYGK